VGVKLGERLGKVARNHVERAREQFVPSRPRVEGNLDLGLLGEWDADRAKDFAGKVAER
jgi:hypothetical protein